MHEPEWHAIQRECAPTPQEDFAAVLAEIWQLALPSERKAIARERGELGIKSKAMRPLTTTEQAVLDNERAWQLDLHRATGFDDVARMKQNELPF